MITNKTLMPDDHEDDCYFWELVVFHS
jgi:hypothetical protein